MRLPFVSRARYEEMKRDRDDWNVIADQQAELLKAAEARYADLNADIERDMLAAQARYDKLFAAYEKLRVVANPAEPTAPVVTSPLAELGPLTRAALAEMANGQSGAVVRAMRNKAVSLWMEQRDNPKVDEIVARAVYAGEAVQAS